MDHIITSEGTDFLYGEVTVDSKEDPDDNGHYLFIYRSGEPLVNSLYAAMKLHD